MCDVAKAEIAPEASRFRLETVDIEAKGNEEWWDKYKYEIPVFHFEGEMIFKNKADVAKLREWLREYEAKQQENVE